MSERANDFKVDNSKISEAISLLTSVYNNPDPRTFAKAKALIDGAAQVKAFAVPERADRVKKDKVVYYESDTPWLDEWLGGGVCRQEVVLWAGVPFIGKSHLVRWMAARYPGAKILDFFGEDKVEDIKRYYKRAGGNELLKNVWLADVQDYAFTAQGVEQVILELKKNEGFIPDILILDNVDIMKSSLYAKADWEDATGVIREIKVLAKRQNIMIFALSLLHEKTRERKGQARFYRAKVGKSAGADIILMIDDVIDNEFEVNRIKAKGRELSADTAKKTLLVDFKGMSVEDIT